MQEIRCALRMGGGGEYRPLVTLQDFQPTLDIGRMIAARFGLQGKIGTQERRAQLGHKGEHEGLISFETHQRILDTIEGKKRAPAARKDLNEDFPLRGFVTCGCCGNAMTAAWSKGCRKRYAYYRCETRGCKAKSKSVPRAKMETGFADILKSLQPTHQFFEIAKAMFRDAWDMRMNQSEAQRSEWQRQLKAAEKQIDDLLDRIVDATRKPVIAAYEKRLDKLECEKIVLAERIEKAVPPKGRLEECMELSLKFLSSPWEIYEKGSYALRQTVMRLAFVEPISYHPNGVYGTPHLSFPFKYLENVNCQKREMVPQGRIELPTSPLPRVRSTTELLRRLTVGG